MVERYAGRDDEPLTKVGREQIASLASRLKDCGVAEIWTSPISRAKESAQVLGDALKLPVTADSRLEEMRMGPWEGLTELEVASRYPETHALWLEKPDLVSLPERESLAMVAQRIVATVGDAARRRGPVLLVTHVAPVRVAALTVLGLPLRRYKTVRVSNADCFVVAPECGDIRRLGRSESLRTELSAAALASAR